jgi:AraC-like DNA-binding protein
VSSASPTAETTLSVRLLWPFARIFPADPRALSVAASEKFNINELVTPDARLPHAMAMRMLAKVVEELGDPLLGLKAGAAMLPGDFDVLGYAASSSSNLGSGLLCLVRYVRVLHGGASLELIQQHEMAACTYRVTDGLEEPPAAHDFAIAALASVCRICAGRDEPALEVHFAHEDRTNHDEYRRMFRCPIRFGMEHTALLFPAARLNWPFLQADPVMGAAFEGRLRAKLDELTRDDKITTLVRELIQSSLSNGELSMESLARRLGMSVATLRRRLAEEGTTHSRLLDEVRKQAAVTLLARPHISVSEIAFLLRFSHPEAFHRAFKRWTGMSASTYRKHRESSQ